MDAEDFIELPNSWLGHDRAERPMTDQDNLLDMRQRPDEEIETRIRALKAVDFDLAYLALLTREGIKPLSRWEKAVDDRVLDALKAMGLCIERIRRKVRSGKTFDETIFSRSAAHLAIYGEHFRNRPVDKSAETVRIEGFLFGYPPCCISQYVKQAYAPNEFPMQPQSILFHLNCKGCVITPSLIGHYERVHRIVQLI